MKRKPFGELKPSSSVTRRTPFSLAELAKRALCAKTRRHTERGKGLVETKVVTEVISVALVKDRCCPHNSIPDLEIY